MLQPIRRFLNLSTFVVLVVILFLPNAQAQTGETIYISTFGGNQIVKVVDAATPTITTINTAAGETPEDIVVGPDGKIYICDSDQSRIRRITQDTFAQEVVYDQSLKGLSDCNAGPCPKGPEGPSFDTLGNLFFNTRDAPHTGVWKIPASQLSPIPAGGGGATPVNVVATQTGSTFGEGTTFDAQDNLLFVDRSGGNVWRFNTSTSMLVTPSIITGLSTPLGIAVNPSGDIFVSDSGSKSVKHYDTNGIGVGNSPFAFVSFTSPDFPAYLQFDASGNLFVVTAQALDASGGKLWRVSPSGTATQLAGFGTGNALNSPSNYALGLGLPASTFTTDKQPIAPGMTTTFKDGTIITQTLQLPADVNMGNAAFMAVSFMQVAPGVFNSTRIPLTGATIPNAWSGGTSVPAGTTLTPITGTGGNGIVAEKLCFASDLTPITPCNIIAPTTLIQLTSSYKTQSPQPVPALIIATDGQNDWANITDFFAADPIGGGTKGLNTDEAIVNLPFSPYSATVQQPINSDTSSVFKANKGVIPVKFSLTLNGAATCTLPAATIALTRTAGATTGSIDESIYTGSADSGSNFRISSCQYVYNLAASSLGPGLYRVDIIINGAVVGNGVFALK